jgi:hypothetical protein
MGATIRAVGHRWHPTLTVPFGVMGRHQVVIGASGSGKTNLMMRTWAGWYTCARTAHLDHGGPRPLLIVQDCKGAPDPRQSRPLPPPAPRHRRRPGRGLARRSVRLVVTVPLGRHQSVDHEIGRGRTEAWGRLGLLWFLGAWQQRARPV